MLLLRKVSSGFQGDEDEQSKNIKVCSLIINREKDNNLAPLFPSELHESKHKRNMSIQTIFLLIVNHCLLFKMSSKVHLQTIH